MNNLFSLNSGIKKNIGYAIIGLAIVLILLIDIVLVMRFQLKALSVAGQKVSEVSKNIKETRENIKNFGLLEAEAARLNEKLTGLLDELLAHQEAAMVLEIISKAAAKYNITIVQAVPSKEYDLKLPSGSQGEFSGVPIEIIGEGEYHDIGLFLNALENDSVLLDICGIEIAKNPRSDKKHLLTIKVISFLPKKILE